MAGDVIKNCKEMMKKAEAAFQSDLSVLRAGRANPQVLDRVFVDYYGAQTPLNQMANISTPEARVLQISVWDQSALPAVEKALISSDLGINPNNDGKVIRLVFPELTEERRKDLVKHISKRNEDAKVSIRNIRREYNDTIKKLEKDSEISEDERKRLEDLVQKQTEESYKNIDKISKEKEEEIMKV